MASIRAVPFQVTTASTTQDITSSGFGTPVAALFILVGETADQTTGTGATDARMSIGATDGTRSWVCSGYGQDGQALSENKSYADSSNVLDMRGMSGGAEIQAAYDSWQTDGVRVDWGTTPGTAYRGLCILFGGADMVAEVGVHDTSGTTLNNEATVTYTDMTVPPECVIAVSAYLNAFSGSESNDWDLSYGWGTGATANVARGWSLENVVGQNRVAGHIASDRIACWGDYAGGTRETLELTRLDTTGGKGRHGVTVRDSADDAIYGYLAFSTGGTASIGVELWEADFTSATTEDYSNVSFMPAFTLLGMSNLHYTQIDTDITSNLAPTMGLAALDDLDSEGDAYSVQVQRNWTGASNAHSYYQSTFLALPNQSGGALAYAGGTPSFTSDGFDFTVTDTVANTKGLLVLTVQEVVVQPSGIASGAGVGAASLDLTIYPAGFDNAARAGTPTVMPEQFLYPNGIASTAAVGGPALNLTIYPDGFLVGARAGGPVVAGPITMTGIASTSAVGVADVRFVLSPPGIAPGSAVGAATLDLIIYPAGVAPTSAVGLATVDSNPSTQAIAPPGVPSAAAVGAAQLGFILHPPGLPATSVVVVATVTITGDQTLSPPGVPSTVVVGVALVRRVGDLGIAGGHGTVSRAYGQGSVASATGQGTRAKARGMASVGG